MSKIKVLAGDIPTGTYEIPHDLLGKEIVMRKQFSFNKIDLVKELDRVEQHTEESVKKLVGTAGWGIAGGLLLGPLGAIGGMLIGGRGKQICFAAYLKDGRKFLAVSDGALYQKLISSVF